jgi:hypothetical protein
MKYKLLFCLSLFSAGMFAQQTANPGAKEKSSVISIYFSGADSKLLNDNITNDPYLEIHYPISFNAGATYTKYLTEHIGITLGFEYSTYKNNFRCAQYNKSTTTQTDMYGYNYYTITQADYTENRTISNIEIPICLRLETSSLERARLFVDLGIKICTNISAKIAETGTVTTMGLYPDPNYPNVGNLVWNQYSTNWQTSGRTPINDYTCKNLSTALYGNAGFIIPVNKRIQFSCSAYYTLGLGDINDSEKGAAYSNYLGIQKDYSPSKITSFGMRIGMLVPFGS